MSSDLQRTVYDSLNLKETDELVQIWGNNHRYEWTDLAFEAMRDILQQRLGELPSQNEPVYEEPKLATPDHFETNSPLDAYLDERNTPDFYDPWDVLSLEKWLKIVAVAAVILSAIQSIFSYTQINQILLSFWGGSFPLGIVFLTGILSIVIVVVEIAFNLIIIYFPIRALATILKILMEMEFNSRGVKRNSPLSS